MISVAKAHTFVIAVLAASCLLSGHAYAVDADAAKELAKQNNCFRCHGVDKDKVGPAWTKTSAKYKGDAKAEEKLIAHVTSGKKVKLAEGMEIDHPALQNADKEQLKNLVDWILSL